jgi:hypothetical protein
MTHTDHLDHSWPVENSWQTSVIKLAQTGNSRAIAFWLNRELVPQGVCAQVSIDQAGCLLVQIVSRQTPDCDRLVRFICNRLCKLNLATLQQVRITAQLVGSSAVLWEKSARLPAPVLAPIAQPDGSAHAALASSVVSPGGSPVSVIAVADGPVSTLPNPTESAAPNPPVQVVHPDPSALPSSPSPSRPAPRPTQKKRAHSSRFQRFWQRLTSSGSTPKSPKLQKSHLHLLTPQSPQVGLSGPSAGRSFSFRPADLRARLGHQLTACKVASLDVTDRSIHWFIGQKPATRAFLIGCGFELSSKYVNPSFQTSKAALTGALRSMVPSGSIQTAASDRIAIIRQPVSNPDDPTIQLIFTNSADLTRLPASQRRQNLRADIPLVTPIDAYRQADMTITNLNHAITSQPAPAKPSPIVDSARQANDSWDEQDPQLTALPDDTSSSDLDGGDHEADKMDFIAQEAQPEETDVASEDIQPEQALTPQELVANGVDLVNLASGSVLSDGVSQLTNSINLLKQGSIHAVGAGESLPEARRPQVFDVKGQRIAYLGYSDSSSRAANGVTPGVNVSVLRQMQEDVKAIRDQVGWVVVSFNWNRELRAYPEDWQIQLAHAAVDAGADLVVGYHPTLSQGAEIYSGRAIIYSLGASVDEYSEKPAGNYEAAALRVTLKDHVMELEFLPIQVKRGLAELAQGATATKILNYLKQASSLFDQPMHSPTSLNSQIRLTLPAAPDSSMPTEPFISYPAPSPDSGAPSDPQP